MSTCATQPIDLGYRPRDWQRRCHRNRRRFTVLALHRRAGKTELAIMELIDKAIKFDRPLGMFYYIAPFLKQAKTIAWARLKQRLQPLASHGAVKINESELTITFPHNGAIIRVFGADHPDGMRGTYLDGVIIDEVAQIKPEVWTDVIQPMLADRLGWALFIGTPKGSNLFSELYFRAGTLADWHAELYTVYDTHALDPKEVERLRLEMSPDSFAREFLCDFSAGGEDQVLSMADIEAAAQRVGAVRRDQYRQAPRVLGVDVARFGDDRSVIQPRQGIVAFEPDIYHGIDNMELASRVCRKIQEWKPDAVFIDAGNGSGVIDRVRQLGHSCTEVHFGGRSGNPRYSNKRSEIWLEMAEWVKAGGVIPQNMGLKKDLAAPTYSFDKQNRILLESKDDIKKRLGCSPDIADALALTFTHPLGPRNRLLDLELEEEGLGRYNIQRNNNIITDFDPREG